MGQVTAEQTQSNAAAPTAQAVPVGVLQRVCACGEHTGGGACESCRKQREATLQRAAIAPGAASDVPPIVHDVLRAPGEPLDAATRRFMEPRFDHDFSGVRVHTDARAAQSARTVDALAYTVGRDVVFGAGQYQPHTSAGRSLLAHELTHTIQQGGQPAAIQAQLTISRPSDSAEQEADRVAHAVADSVAFQQRIVGVAGPVDEVEEEAFIQPIRVSARTRGSLIQRAVNFAAGSVHAVRDAAVQIVTGGAAGVTLPMLNGHILRSEAETRAAINRPTLVVHAPNAPGGAPAPAPSNPAPAPPQMGASDDIHGPITDAFRRRQGLPPGGVDESGMAVGPSDAEIKYRLNFPGVEVRVTSVPNNVGSFDETVLTNGPWTTVATRANLAVQLGLAECAAATAGNATLTARGVPSDAAVAAANRTHEDHHATDHERVFNTIMVPWDTALTTALNNRQRFRGADQPAAEAALFRAMGGTPDEIATNLWTAWTTAGNDFHTQPNGGPLRVSNPVSDPGCTAVTVDVQQ